MNTRAYCILISLLASGCATPAFEPNQTRESAGAVPPGWSSVANRQAVQANWIAQFNDPMLSALVLEAQQHNRELQSLAARIDQSNALAKQAGAALLPTANLNVSGNRQSEGGFRSNSSTASLDISWELDLWGRIASEKHAAQASATAVAADYQFAQYSLAAAVARAYFSAIDANIQLAIVQKSEANLERIYELLNLQNQEGVASAQDLAVSRSDLATVRGQLASVDGASRDALRALELLMGRYPAADIKVRDTLPVAPALPGAGLPSELLERRPDVIAAEQRVAAAFYSVNAAKAARLPSLSLTALSGGSASQLSNLLDRDNRSWSTGAGLLAPLLQGGALKAQVDNANAEQKAAIAAYGQTALNAFNDVESSLDEGSVRLKQEQQLQQAYTSAKEAYRIALLRFNEGDIDLFDVLSVQQRLFEREMELMTVRRAILEQRVNLYLALGGAWS